VVNFSMDEGKHKTASDGCAVIRKGKLMGKTFAIALLPVPGRVNLGDEGLIARR
jgi:hypothetical protein